MPPPPRYFNPRGASAEDLAYYGLPSRPSEAGQLADWEYTVRNAQHRWCGTQVEPTTRFGSVAADSGNWSGYVTKEGGTTTYDAARGWFTLKCASTGRAGIWVGIGGSGSVGGSTNFKDALWQAGWDTYRRQFWYEGVGGSIDTKGAVYFTSYTTATPQCNDQGYAIVYNNNSQRYVFVQDLTNKGYASKPFSRTSDVFRSAEWILERPACQYGYYKFAGGIGMVPWSGDFWRDIDTQGYLGIGQASTNYKVRMVDGNANVLVNTSNLYIDLNTNTYRQFTSSPTGGSGTDYACA